MRSATSATCSSTSPRTRRCSSGSTATRTRGPKPQENFAREIMELFTMGVGNYTEADVYAGARVFTGWNLTRPGAAAGGTQQYEFFYNAEPARHRRQDLQLPDLSRRQQDDPGARGGRRHAGRHRSDRRARRHPETGALAGRESCIGFFVSGVRAAAMRRWSTASPACICAAARHASRHARRCCCRRSSGRARSSRATPGRWSSSPARSRKTAGSDSRSDDALTPLVEHGTDLFEPPDVERLGRWGRRWFSTGAMLARMNFASALDDQPEIRPRDAARPHAKTPESLLSFMLDRSRAGADRRGASASCRNYCARPARGPAATRSS